MLSFDKDMKTLGFVLLLAAMGEPARRRREKEKERTRQRAQEDKKRHEARKKEERRRRRAERERNAPPSTPTEDRRWPDEVYEHYRQHGYWRGSGGGSWTSSKHPDDWEHCHLK